MSNYVALNVQEHGEMGWAPLDGLAQFSDQAIVPVVTAELSTLLHAHPLAFARLSDEQFRLVAVLGLHDQDNLFVLDNGLYWGGYVPAQLRAYPFAIKRGSGDQANKAMFLFDAESGCLRDNPDSEAGELRFFNHEGQLDKVAKHTLNFLVNLNASMQATQSAVDALAEKGLLVPWQFSIENPDPDRAFVQGLYRADLKLLHELSGEDLKELEEVFALHLAHAQILATGRTSILRGLYRMRKSGGNVMDFASISDDDAFDFGFNN